MIANDERISASAPGKLMLYGEHAVVYGYPCLVTAVDMRVRVTVGAQPSTGIWIQPSSAPVYESDYAQIASRSYPRDVAFVAAAVRLFHLDHDLAQGLRISTDGPALSYGLGSSSAVTVATVYALQHMLGLGWSQQQIFRAAFDVVLDVQGTGSGFDVASAVYGGTLFYSQLGQQIKPVMPPPALPLVIGYSGAKVSTVSLVDAVARRREQNPQIIDTIFRQMDTITRQALQALQQQNLSQLGELADIDQRLLDDLGISTLSLDTLIDAARDAGAAGAKLSGAGGGDCMFAWVDEARREAVEQAITDAGGTVVTFDVNADGARLEAPSRPTD